MWLATLGSCPFIHTHGLVIATPEIPSYFNCEEIKGRNLWVWPQIYSL